MLEHFDALTRGAILGAMVAAPVGPVGLLCIRRTLKQGLWYGFATGFGAALADTAFSAIAAYGVSAILSLIQAYTGTIHLLGGLFLLVVAWHTWHDKPRQPDEARLHDNGKLKATGHGMAALKAISGSFLIMLTNPAALFGTLAVIAAFGNIQSDVEAAKPYVEATKVVAGVFMGSSLWWLTLSGGTALVRRHFTEKRVLWINRGTALLLAPFALWALAKGALTFLGLDWPV